MPRAEAIINSTGKGSSPKAVPQSSEAQNSTQFGSRISMRNSSEVPVAMPQTEIMLPGGSSRVSNESVSKTATASRMLQRSTPQLQADTHLTSGNMEKSSNESSAKRLPMQIPIPKAPNSQMKDGVKITRHRRNRTILLFESAFYQKLYKTYKSGRLSRLSKNGLGSSKIKPSRQ